MEGACVATDWAKGRRLLLLFQVIRWAAKACMSLYTISLEYCNSIQNVNCKLREPKLFRGGKLVFHCRNDMIF